VQKYAWENETDADADEVDHEAEREAEERLAAREGGASDVV
jgi:hypothetical protein